MKTIKLFGFYLAAKQHDHQDTITTNDEASRKRKFSPNREEDDDDSFIPKKPKLCDDGEEGEEAVPPSEFHPLSVTTDDAISGKRKLSLNQEEDDDSFNDGEEDEDDEDAVPPISAFFPEEANDSFIPKKPKLLRLSDDGKKGEEAVHPLSFTTDDAIFGKRKLSSNQEEDDDDSFIPKKPKLLRLIDDGKLETGSPNSEEANDEEEEAVPPRKLAEGSSIQEEDYDLSLSTKPGIFKLFGVYIYIDQEGHTVIQNPNQDDQEEEEEDENEVEVEDQAPIQNPNQEGVEEEAPDPPEGNVIFMFEKELTSSDVARNHNRLLITKRTSLQLMAALTEEERGRVEVNGGRGDNLRVVTTDANGAEYVLKLKRWAGLGALVLKHEWGKLVRANRLECGDSIRGWGYRVDGDFRLFLFTIKNQFN